MADLTIVSTDFQKGVTPVFQEDALHQYGPMIAGEDLFDGAVVYFLAGTDGTRVRLASAAGADPVAPATFAKGIVMRGAKTGGTVSPYFFVRVAGLGGGTDMGAIFLSNTAGRLADAAGAQSRRLGFSYEIHGQTDLIACLFFNPALG